MSLHRAGRPLIALTMFVLLAGVMLLTLECPVEGAAPQVLFVAPKGEGIACTQAEPCELAAAMSLVLDGGTLYVAGGIYYGPGPSVITVTRSITLYGGWNEAPDGPVVRDSTLYATILDAQGQGRVVYAEGCTFVLDGFVIQNGNATKAPRECMGGGILSWNARPTILNNTFRYNVACTMPAPGTWGKGGGIAVYQSTGPARIRGNRVEANIAGEACDAAGGGIYVYHSGWAEVHDNEIVFNTAAAGGHGYGGGVAVVQSDDTEVTGNHIEGNYGNTDTTSSGRGGGVYWEASRAGEVEHNHIEFNDASRDGIGSGGGVAAYWADLIWIIDNQIEGNSAGSNSTLSSEGGAIKVVTSKDVLVTRNLLLGNTALGQYGLGGGIWMESNTSFRLTNNILAKNAAGRSGGAIGLWADAARPVTGTLLHNTIAGNDSGVGDGLVAVWVDTPFVRLQMVNNLLAYHSSALRLVPGSTANLSGTLFFGDSAADVIGGGSVTQYHTLTGQDPQLNLSLHLSTGSPAIDAGVTSSLTNDIDGDPRPLGAGWDIGADEYTPTSWAFVPLVIRRR